MLSYTVKQGKLSNIVTDCVIVLVSDQGKLNVQGKELDKASQKYLSQKIEAGDLPSKFGAMLLLHDVFGLSADRVLLVHAGEKELTDRSYIQLQAKMWQFLKDKPYQSILDTTTLTKVSGRNLAWAVQQSMIAASHSRYQFTGFKSNPKDAYPETEVCYFALTPKSRPLLEKAVSYSDALVKGMSWVKDLGNMPGNACTPTYLAEQATALTKQHKGLTTKVLSESDMKKLKMESFLSVSRGSVQPAKCIVMEYNGGKKSLKPIALVGKGVTFDSGGISLKPGAQMDEMKYDMCGAATVLAAMRVAAELSLPINIVAVIGATENMPSHEATKPGDIVTSMSGKTIEIMNTDAEGRLILCDLLTYVRRFDPKVVIDLATLTGAMLIALGHYMTGLFCNDSKLTSDLLKASDEASDAMWHMPMNQDFQAELDSPFADMMNVSGRLGGSSVAASFLAHFTEGLTWAHLDIAGVAWPLGKEKTASGRPLPALMQYLFSQSTCKGK